MNCAKPSVINHTFPPVAVSCGLWAVLGGSNAGTFVCISINGHISDEISEKAARLRAK